MKKLGIMTKLTLVLLVGVGLFSIASVKWRIGPSTSESPGDVETHRAAAVQAEYEAIIRRFYEEIFSRGNFDQAAQLIATDYVDHSQPGSGLAPSIKGSKQVYTLFRVAFPDLHFTVEEMIVKEDKVMCRITMHHFVLFDNHFLHGEGEEMIVKEDKVMCRITMHGTHKGNFIGIPPTGKPVTVTGIDIFRIADGAIVERWGTSDGMALMQLLGVIDPMVWQRTLSLVEKGTNQIPNTNGEMPQESHHSSHITDLDNPVQLRNVFQSDSGHIRLIALLSPN